MCKLKTYPVPAELVQTLLNNKPIQTVHKLFKQHNFKIRIAGGYVRDAAVLKLPANDIDLATDATPEEMHKIFKEREIRTFNVNGEVHGTVSCLIEGETLEITTLRSDVATDGRKATVEFHRDWAKDAERRDLTIGQLFLDLDTFEIIDHFNGVEHLQKNIVKFVGDAQTRIREDYLRILRYFRFLARMTPPEKEIFYDKATLETIKANKAGLLPISNERKWTELKKICIHRAHADTVMRMMVEDCALADVIGLACIRNHDRYLAGFSSIYKRQRRVLLPSKNNKNEEAKCATTLADLYKPSSSIVLLCPLDDVNTVVQAAKTLKLSNAEREDAVVCIQYKSLIDEELRDCDKTALESRLKRLCFRLQRTVPNVKQRLLYAIIVWQSLREQGEDKNTNDFFEVNRGALLSVFNDEWPIPKLPVNGQDVVNTISFASEYPMSRKYFTNMMEKAYEQSDFTMGSEELLQLCKDNIPTNTEQYIKRKKKSKN